MFMSFHTFDDPKAVIRVERTEDSAFQGVSDFSRHPFCLKLGQAVYYLRKHQLETIVLGGMIELRKHDKEEIERRLS